jgi:hypothetical protein
MAIDACSPSAEPSNTGFTPGRGAHQLFLTTRDILVGDSTPGSPRSTIARMRG